MNATKPVNNAAKKIITNTAQTKAAANKATKAAQTTATKPSKFAEAVAAQSKTKDSTAPNNTWSILGGKDSPLTDKQKQTGKVEVTEGFGGIGSKLLEDKEYNTVFTKSGDKYTINLNNLDKLPEDKQQRVIDELNRHKKFTNTKGTDGIKNKTSNFWNGLQKWQRQAGRVGLGIAGTLGLISLLNALSGSPQQPQGQPQMSPQEQAMIEQMMAGQMASK